MKFTGEVFLATLIFMVLVVFPAVVVFGSASGVGSEAESDIEYKVVNGTPFLTDREALERELNTYGSDGWQLVYVLDRSALRAAVSGEFQDLLILKK